MLSAAYSSARGVGADPQRRLQALHAGRVDDHAAAAGAHGRDAVLGHQERALEVDVKDAVPHLLRQFVRGYIGL
jgi:hypothetical protein